MSQTYSLICKDCNESLWVGQSSYSKQETGFLYGPHNGTWQFLLDHQKHHLVFVSETDYPHWDNIKERSNDEILEQMDMD